MSLSIVHFTFFWELKLLKKKLNKKKMISFCFFFLSFISFIYFLCKEENLMKREENFKRNSLPKPKLGYAINWRGSSLRP